MSSNYLQRCLSQLQIFITSNYAGTLASFIKGPQITKILDLGTEIGRKIH